MDAASTDLQQQTLAAARSGDEAAFVALVEPHRRELRVHCYRMLGSFDEAEDLVQETFLRAWKGIGDFAGRSSLRAWLYRIATNACLDALDGRARRVLPHHLSRPSDAGDALPPPRTDLPWLQPFPDRRRDGAGGGSLVEPAGPAAPRDAEPDAIVEARETLELAFLAAIQHLPPRQRAVFVLRDVLGWPAKQTAALLESSLAGVNSALQRARTTMREQLPERRSEWVAAREPSAEERAVLRRYMLAVERADVAAVAELLADDVRTTMPPWTLWLQGRDTVVAALTASWNAGSPNYVGRFRMLPTRANGRPAVASYVRDGGDSTFRAFAIGVVRIEDGRIAEITAFHDSGLFRAFELPASLTG
ncbi:sigma-70 family RNA polymerase sigma factor [Actinopolymorpha sp. NPDC004070]|uniref:sigma-70 family RNA polymerase sigma factor n=1 Tax=Actinopolymorpha sp. NPDC004070 TaxID=3154548 RepID=UPI0033A98CB7